MPRVSARCVIWRSKARSTPVPAMMSTTAPTHSAAHTWVQKMTERTVMGAFIRGVEAAKLDGPREQVNGRAVGFRENVPFRGRALVHWR